MISELSKKIGVSVADINSQINALNNFYKCHGLHDEEQRLMFYLGDRLRKLNPNLEIEVGGFCSGYEITSNIGFRNFETFNGNDNLIKNVFSYLDSVKIKYR